MCGRYSELCVCVSVSVFTLVKRNKRTVRHCAGPLQSGPALESFLNGPSKRLDFEVEFSGEAGRLTLRYYAERI